MDIQNILAQVDAYFDADRGKDAERLLQQSVAEAEKEQDEGAKLQLLNELIGYYREVSQHEMVYKTVAQALSQTEHMGLEGTIPHATTLLNAATAYRACGKLEESMGFYRQVQEIYGRLLEPDNMLMAGLQNNISLLYQEMGNYGAAKERLLEALDIVEKNNAGYETAVTYANLAGTCMQLGENEEAYRHAMKSLEIFKSRNVEDSHSAAALATLGMYFYREKDYGRAVQYYRQAMAAVEKSLGRNDYYRRLEENLRACEAAYGTAEPEKAGGVPGTGRESRKAGNAMLVGGEAGDAVPVESEAGNVVTAEGESENAVPVGGEAGSSVPVESENENVAMAGDEAGNTLTFGGEAGGTVTTGTEVQHGKGVDITEGEEWNTRKTGTGLALSREYYETYGKPMIQEQFPEYAGRIAVGLAGRGSDCFGYDDAASRDHDWGPDFCMWVTDETYKEIGEALQQAYEKLPNEFKGYRRAAHVNGRNRRGVLRISDFYRDLAGADAYEAIDWKNTSDTSLAAAVNGEIFRDEEGIFSAFREKLRKGYPEEICCLKLAEAAARFAQTAQYNYPRMLGRGDRFTAEMMVWDGMKEAMKLQHYIEGKYPPHDKWLLRSLQDSEEGREIAGLLERIAAGLKKDGAEAERSRVGTTAEGQREGADPNTELRGDTAENPVKATAAYIEQLGAYFAMEMYREGFISDTESYLDAHSEELVFKASLAAKSSGELVDEIARLEFEAFDKVKNEGGRASCQNDWSTFSIMRKSQYLTWDRVMLLQYLYDFYREYHRGHNLIEEKYGRMMESTAPEKYEEIKSHFPELTQEKKNIIEQIVGLQVKWMEEFSASYPTLAGNARNIHTYEDTPEDTSYETYLRGELGTYSDKMLELYGRYVVEYARTGRNTAYEIMENSVKMYGYQDVESAEREIAEYEAGHM